KIINEHRQKQSDNPDVFEAEVLVHGEDSFFLYNEYSAYGTEVVYDVLNFNVSEDVQDAIGEAPFKQFEVSELEGIETDYVLVNRKPETDAEALREELSVALDIEGERILIVSADDFITNDLISLEGQTKIILEQLE